MRRCPNNTLNNPNPTLKKHKRTNQIRALKCTLVYYKGLMTSLLLVGWVCAIWFGSSQCVCVEFSSSLNPLSEQPTFTAMVKRNGKAKAGSPKLCLVRWLEDETVDAKQKVYVGATVNFK